jgi:hypothetical protein
MLEVCESFEKASEVVEAKKVRQKTNGMLAIIGRR